jgi:Ca-activated chloride channel family protein
MNRRLMVRLFLVSVLISFGALAVFNGCAVQAPRPQQTGGQSPLGDASTAPPYSDATTFDLNQSGGTTTPAPAAGPAPATAMPPPARGEELWVFQKEESRDAVNGNASGGQRFGSGIGSGSGTGGNVFSRQQMQQVAPQQQTRLADGRTGLASAAAPTTQPRRVSKPLQPAVTEDMIPGSGCLVAKLPDKMVPVPLKHTDVKAAIAGYVATVDVTQQYHNPYAEKIEAVYVFPLPDNAAVNEFLMTIGDRKIRGIIREKDEAQRIYNEAKRQGYAASLLTQQRPNIFTQSVANIEPGKQIDVNIKYFHTLTYADGWYEYHFPMVVGPRFNPPGYSDGIGARPRESSAIGTTGQPTEVPYLRPNERSGHDITLAVDIDAGVKVEEIKSINHQVDLQRPDDAKARVELAPSDSIPNKDFVLRYKVAGSTVKSALMAQKSEKGDGGYFTLMIFPPESLKDLPRKPLELVFTLDVSGSMSGRPIAQAKSAVTYALKHMRPDDTFNIVRFASSAEQMAPRAVPAEDENIRAALKYIESMEAGGGTMMIEGIRKSLQVTPDPDHLRFVAFLTDGYIGNEPEILREVHNLLGPTRIFSFGVGSSVNRCLLDNMAKFGQGCAAYLSLNQDGGQVMAEYFERISHPALTDIRIDFGGMQVSEVYPSKLPDLFVGQPVIVTGRYSGNADATTVKVAGKVGGEARELAINVNASDAANQHKGIAPVWARAKIADISDRATYDGNVDLAGGVKQVALEYGLMSAYTSFVAVDSSRRTEGDHGTTVAVPVPVPDGVKYETTVPEGGQ